MLDQLDFEILILLYKRKEPLASEQIATWINRSSRTVRNRIKAVNEKVGEYGATIEMIPGIGIQLKVENAQKFSRLMATIDGKKSTPTDSDLRECITILISQRNYLTAEDLCEKLFISRSKLTTILKELRRILKQYKLRLAAKTHHGIKIEGSELNLRRFIASYYVQESFFENGISRSYEQNLLGDSDYQGILAIIQEQMMAIDYAMPIAIQKNLANHLVIMLHRISEGRAIDVSQSLRLPSNNQREYQLAKSIITQIEIKHSVTVSVAEVDYISMHLIGKKVLNATDTKTIPPEINQLVADILQKVYLDKKIDLLQDFDLRMMLALHLVPLISRIMYGIELKNPIIEEVKVKSVAGYDLAIICGQMINEKYQTILSDHELSYFALHFDVALHKKQEKIDKKDVLIICASGRASAQLLKIKFEQLFAKYLNTISVCDVSEIPGNPNEDYDYIFTTITLPEVIRLSVPVFEFSFFLDDWSIQKIESVFMKKEEAFVQYFSKDLFFGKLNLTNRSEILDFMIDKIEQVRQVPEVFGQLIWEREKFLGTDLVTNIAFPHPSRVVTDDTFIAVALLKNSVLWEKRRVKIVILVSISKHDSELYKPLLEKIVAVMTSPERVDKILRQRTFEALTIELQNIQVKR